MSDRAVDVDDGLLAVLAHGLLNPLTAVVGFNNLVLERWDELDDNARREMIQSALDNAKFVADMLSDLSRGIPPETLAFLDGLDTLGRLRAAREGPQ